MTKHKEILMYRKLLYSQRQISDILSVSRNTISKVYAAADAVGLQWNELVSLTEEEVLKKLFPVVERESMYEKPDVQYMYQELKRKGVTLMLLWREYVAECKSRNVMYLQYSQYCNNYQKHRLQTKATMHFDHLPAQRIEVDWAGKTIPIYTPYEGIKKAYLFVGTLPYSQYSYVEVMDNMKQENWIQAHVNMFKYFGGTTPIIYPDNLKTGVISNPKNDDVILNKAYEEMANYYNVVIIPTLPRSPKGKPSVEGVVGKVTSQLIAHFRNREFESIYEANTNLRRKLDEFNNTPFQKREGSRKSVFEKEERMMLQLLPKEIYEYATWKTCTVQYNYHIAVNKNYYSVPYEHIKHKVEARLTSKTVEIYYQGARICSHSRIPDGEYKYSTHENHMPEKHLRALGWNGERFRQWAKKIGPQTFDVVDRLLKSYKVEQQGYKSCNALLHLVNKYTSQQLEQACQQALTYLRAPRYKNIKLILESSQRSEDEKESAKGAYVRGASYYGGGSDE